MFYEDEVLVLLFGLGILTVVLLNRAQLRSIPASRLLFTAFLVLLAGWVFTVLEGFLLANLLNYFEHICYAASSLVTAVWCWKIFGKAKETG